MFKLAKNGNILMDVAAASPPSAAFVVEALERSPYADCAIDHESIAAYFKQDTPVTQLIVAQQKDAHIEVALSDDKMQAIAKLTTAQGGKMINLEDAKRAIVKVGVTRGYKQVYLENLLKQQLESLPGT
ncbi:hypothetical protein AC626_00795, partial [Pseudoalteromonas rubra]